MGKFVTENQKTLLQVRRRPLSYHSRHLLRSSFHLSQCVIIIFNSRSSGHQVEALPRLSCKAEDSIGMSNAITPKSEI